MANHKLLAPFILEWEGGWANNPADKGGATMKGITLDTYTTYCRLRGKPKPTVNDLRKITEAEWYEIFKTMYWDRWKADEIKSQSVANILVDWVWGSGSYGITIPQRLLGVVSDGAVGVKTLAAVNSQDAKTLYDRIYAEKAQYYKDITDRSIAEYEKKIGRKATERELMTYTNKRFYNGWMNRLKSMKFVG